MQGAVPAGFHPHPKIKKLLEARAEMGTAKEPLDWSTAEALAFASVATEGLRVRLTGQDTERGTFSQRHSVLHDYQDGHTYIPLQHLDPNAAPIQIFNSPLSETAVLGFEYGFSLDYPDGLILWEAQFGDFWNAAQPIVDQFIASAEDKWERLSGIVLLLPHGFEGQGPEHSSRQAIGCWRKPLVIMTPKSLLRHPKAVSSLEDCAKGIFQRVLPDTSGSSAKHVERILLCTGKIYYDLDAHRTETKRNDVDIIRLEQLYPLRRDLVESALSSYPKDVPVVWVQEEPENMGALTFMRINFGQNIFGHPLSSISRDPSASPATGSHRQHKQEQQKLVEKSFEIT